MHSRYKTNVQSVKGPNKCAAFGVLEFLSMTLLSFARESLLGREGPTSNIGPRATSLQFGGQFQSSASPKQAPCPLPGGRQGPPWPLYLPDLTAPHLLHLATQPFLWKGQVESHLRALAQAVASPSTTLPRVSACLTASPPTDLTQKSLCGGTSLSTLYEIT